MAQNTHNSSNTYYREHYKVGNTTVASETAVQSIHVEKEHNITHIHSNSAYI